MRRQLPSKRFQPSFAEDLCRLMHKEYYRGAAIEPGENCWFVHNKPYASKAEAKKAIDKSYKALNASIK